MEVTERETEIFVGMQYRHELFESGTMWRMLGHYEELLKSVLTDPGLGIRDLGLLREEEKRQVLVEWNQTKVDFPQDKCIQQLFEEQVVRSPQAIAVEYEGRRLTYAELNRKANQLAHWLRQLGVGPEMLVALCTERSPEMVVGLLGILKAGGAYVPLDPAYPVDRLSFMLEDTQAPVLLTQQKLVAQLPQHMGIMASLDEDADWKEIAQHPDHNPEVNTTPESLAYVIYTSGSTGKPKGAMNIHRGICNLALEQARLFNVREGKGILQFASFSFDAATWEWAMALINGARLVLASREAVLPGPQLIELLRQSQTNIVTLPPTVLALFADDVELPSLETVVVAGEACSVQLAARWGAKCRMHNAYGPSETTVCSTVSGPLDGKRVPSIGRPIANMEMYVLDQRMDPVPVGVQGELYIGGTGLARGYVRWPELTAERFVPHPFSQIAGDRLYRTGDLGRWRADGTIEFRGRLDHQVKVRGFRIELGEVESALEQHKDVKQAVVIAREDRPGDRRLVGYVVMNGREGPAATGELRDYIRSKLPNYMVPGALVRLESVPLNANGKVDRNALPAPQEFLNDREYQAPRTPMEEVLTAIWADLLGVERVGIHDNFFELGGHSLLATQVVSRVRKDLNLEVPLSTMFADPTVMAVARDLERYGMEKYGVVLPPIQPVERGRDLLLSFAQQRLWFIEQLQPGNKAFNLPVAVRLTGALNVKALEKAFDEIVRRHEILRTVFVSTVGQPLQRIHSTDKIDLQVVDLSDLLDEEKHKQMQKRLLEHAAAPFDLSEGPLLRVLLLQQDADQHVLQLAMHHIVSDGWSMSVLLRELVALYNDYAEGRAHGLKELNIQYADYAAWQREWMQTAVLERQLDYWRKQLQDVEVLSLPPDRPAPQILTHRGGMEKLEIGPEVREELQAVIQRQGITLFMAMLAALQTLLHCLTDREDIAVGSNIANRNREEIEGLIGFFVNTLVLRTSLSGDPRFDEILQRVQQCALGAYANQDLPFDRLVEELSPGRETGHAPFFRIKVSMGNTSQQTAGMHGLNLTLLPPEVIYAESDLVFFVGETENRLGISVVYDSDLYRAATALRLLSQFAAVLHAVAKDPGMRLSEIKALLALYDKRHSQQQEQDLETKARQKLRTKRRSAATASSGGKGEKP
jgi:amino acid adenylation domain-containing protein